MVSRTHYCCPTCRVAVKEEWRGKDSLHSCGQPMIPMGRNFKAPRKDNKSQWRKIALVIETASLLREFKTVSEVKSRAGLRRSDKKNWDGPPAKARTSLEDPRRWRKR